MKSQLDHVLRSALRKPTDRINVLYFPYDGWFEYTLDIPNVYFYIFIDEVVYPYKSGYWHENFIPIHDIKHTTNNIELDCIVCNSRSSHSFKAQDISEKHHIPIIMFDHDLPSADCTPQFVKFINSQLPKMSFVFPTSEVESSWAITQEKIVLPYGIPVLTEEKTDNILCVGDYGYKNRDLLMKLLDMFPTDIHLGFNFGATQEYLDYDYVIKNMASSRFFVTCTNNTRSPIMTLLAMGCGCIVITNRNKWTENVINGKNGLLFNSVSDIRRHINEVMGDPEKMNSMGKQAQQYIIENFPKDQFNSDFRSLLEDISKRVYII